MSHSSWTTRVSRRTALPSTDLTLVGFAGIQPDFGLFAFSAQFEPSPMTFNEPVILRVKHDLEGLQPGDVLPLTEWDEAAGEWVDIGDMVVTADGQWLEGTLTSFSHKHINCSHPKVFSTLSRI